MNKIRSSGFHIAAQKETVLTKELAEQFYMEHKDKEFFGELTEFMTSGLHYHLHYHLAIPNLSGGARPQIDCVLRFR